MGSVFVLVNYYNPGTNPSVKTKVLSTVEVEIYGSVYMKKKIILRK